jgi:hypothetical protein
MATLKIDTGLVCREIKPVSVCGTRVLLLIRTLGAIVGAERAKGGHARRLRGHRDGRHRAQVVSGKSRFGLPGTPRAGRTAHTPHTRAGA